MPQISTTWVVLPILAVAAVAALIWKKRRYSKKVGRINKILFYPVKSLMGLEVNEAKCTKLGLEVNGLLDRSFMLISEENKLLSQREAPTLSLLNVKMVDSKIIISGPNVEDLTVKIESTPNPNQKLIECKLHGEVCHVAECCEEASKWFQDYLKMPNIRLTRFFPDFPNRKFVQNHPFFQKLRENNPISLQDLAAFHVISQSSIDDLNSKLVDKQISFRNFRPNILAIDCEPFAEDCWQYIKFGEEVEMENVIPITRCLMTTVDSETGILTQKEPLATLRKYRIPRDPEILKITGSIPCFGTACFLLKSGTIRIQDEIFATISRPLETTKK